MTDQYLDFRDPSVTYELYTGHFNSPNGKIPVQNLPPVMLSWVMLNHPATEYLFFGPCNNFINKMTWWMGGWDIGHIDPDIPSWSAEFLADNPNGLGAQ